jgi:hypothetical protein
MAVSVIEAKGTFITIGVTRLREYRSGNLIIHYRPQGFSIGPYKDGLRVAHYTPRAWDSDLGEAAGRPLPTASRGYRRWGWLRISADRSLTEKGPGLPYARGPFASASGEVPHTFCARFVSHRFRFPNPK